METGSELMREERYKVMAMVGNQRTRADGGKNEILRLTCGNRTQAMW